MQFWRFGPFFTPWVLSKYDFAIDPKVSVPEDGGAGVGHDVHLEPLHELGLLPADPGQHHSLRH